MVVSISSYVAPGDRQAELRDHLRSFRSDDMRAEDLAVRLTDDELHKTLALTNRARFATRHEGELTDLELEPFSFAARSVSPTLATCGLQ
jgi:hypothetical protein